MSHVVGHPVQSRRLHTLMVGELTRTLVSSAAALSYTSCENPATGALLALSLLLKFPQSAPSASLLLLFSADAATEVAWAVLLLLLPTAPPTGTSEPAAAAAAANDGTFEIRSVPVTAVWEDEAVAGGAVVSCAVGRAAQMMRMRGGMSSAFSAACVATALLPIRQATAERDARTRAGTLQATRVTSRGSAPALTCRINQQCRRFKYLMIQPPGGWCQASAETPLVKPMV